MSCREQSQNPFSSYFGSILPYSHIYHSFDFSIWDISLIRAPQCRCYHSASPIRAPYSHTWLLSEHQSHCYHSPNASIWAHSHIFEHTAVTQNPLLSKWYNLLVLSENIRVTDYNSQSRNPSKLLVLQEQPTATLTTHVSLLSHS